MAGKYRLNLPDPGKDSRGLSKPVDYSLLRREFQDIERVLAGLSNLAEGLSSSVSSLTSAGVPAPVREYPFSDAKDPSGLIDADNLTESYDETARTFTITHATDVAYLNKGVKTSLGSSFTTTAHPETPTSTLQYFCYIEQDTGNEVWEDTPWEFDDIMLAAVFWIANNDPNKLPEDPDGWWVPFKETHGLMDHQSHRDSHKAYGTIRYNPLELSEGTPFGYTVDSTSDNQPGVRAIDLLDEDNKCTLPEKAASGPYSHLSLTTTGTIGSTGPDAEAYPIRRNPSTGVIQYNDGTGWTDVGVNDYVNVWGYAFLAPTGTYAQQWRFPIMQAQREYNTQLGAEAESPEDINLANFRNLAPEYVLLTRYTIQRQGTGYRIRSVTNYYGSRNNPSSSAGGTGVAGSGTINHLPIWTGTETLGDSPFYKDAVTDDIYLTTGNKFGVDSVLFTSTNEPVAGTQIGEAWFDTNDYAMSLRVSANVVAQIPQEDLDYVYNDNGALVDGQVVGIVGSQGNRIKVDVVQATTTTNLALGAVRVVTEPIASAGTGFVAQRGTIRGLNTSAYIEGDLLWLQADGSLGTAPPPKPYSQVGVAYVTRAHATNGSIYVAPTAIERLSLAPDVNFSSLTAGDYMKWDAAGYWVNSARDWYTQSEADARFVNVTGDTMTGNLNGTTATWSGDVEVQGKFTNSNGYTVLGDATVTRIVRPNDTGVLTLNGGGETYPRFATINIWGQNHATKPDLIEFFATNGNNFVWGDVDVAENFNVTGISTLATLRLGGVDTNDTLISSDAESSSNSALTTAGYVNARYLGITDKASDSELLDGQDSTYYLNTSSGAQTKAGHLYSNAGFSASGNRVAPVSDIWAEMYVTSDSTARFAGYDYTLGVRAPVQIQGDYIDLIPGALSTRTLRVEDTINTSYVDFEMQDDVLMTAGSVRFDADTQGIIWRDADGDSQWILRQNRTSDFLELLARNDDGSFRDQIMEWDRSSTGEIYMNRDVRISQDLEITSGDLTVGDRLIAESGMRVEGDLSGTSGFANQGLEFTYESSASRTRILSYDRTLNARVGIRLDALDFQFYINNSNMGMWDSTGLQVDDDVTLGNSTSNVLTFYGKEIRPPYYTTSTTALSMPSGYVHYYLKTSSGSGTVNWTLPSSPVNGETIWVHNNATAVWTIQLVGTIFGQSQLSYNGEWMCLTYSSTAGGWLSSSSQG